MELELEPDRFYNLAIQAPGKSFKQSRFQPAHHDLLTSLFSPSLSMYLQGWDKLS